MRRALGAATVAAAILTLQVSSASATDSTSCSSQTVSSGSRVSCPAATTDPNQAAYDSLKTRLGGDIANALTAQHRLSATLDQFAGIEQSLSSEVAQEEALIASLEAEIARLDAEIADTEARIEVEKQQLAAMSRIRRISSRVGQRAKSGSTPSEPSCAHEKACRTAAQERCSPRT